MRCIYFNSCVCMERKLFQGLEPLAFGASDKESFTSLVSEGTEAILINRKFFTQNSDERYWRKLRATVSFHTASVNQRNKLKTDVISSVVLEATQ